MTAPTPVTAPAPEHLEDLLDPVWLTAALDEVHGGERIVAVGLLGTAQTLAQKVRFSITIEGKGGRRRSRSFCVKAHFDRVSGQTLGTETRFCRDLRPLLDLRAPRAHYTGIDRATGRSLVVMDDVQAEGGRFLDAHQPYSVVTCADALGQLARLHAATWADDRWAVDWLRPRVEHMADLFPAETLQALLDDGRGEELPAALLDARRLRQAMRVTATLPPTCVVHGDTHSGNVYLNASGEACWLDWQVTQQGHWSIDVSYHLATALAVEDRRAHERDLLRHYLDELGALGVEPPAWEEAWDRYRLGFTWGYFLWVITRISSRSVVLVHLPRLGAALVDHDTFGRLGVA
jgi:aminoglycoside phosphotransferase (APT) family kinase protein